MPIIQFGDCELIQFDGDVIPAFDIGPTPDIQKKYLFTMDSASITCDCKINEDDIEKLIGPRNLSNYELHTAPRIHQIRRHHKTRINKKWKKRYGWYYLVDVYKLSSLPQKEPENYEFTASYDRTYEAYLTPDGFKERNKYKGDER